MDRGRQQKPEDAAVPVAVVGGTGEGRREHRSHHDGARHQVRGEVTVREVRRLQAVRDAVPKEDEKEDRIGAGDREGLFPER